MRLVEQVPHAKRLTNGEVMPLKSPTNRSSRMMVVIACNVEWYLPAVVGFWNLTLAIYDLSNGFQLEAQRDSPVSKGNPTTRPAMP